MDAWLKEIHDTRRALANLGRVIDDNLTVDVILMGVVYMHRAVVRQFSRIMAPGTRPTLQQVLNTLKSETETDELVRDEDGDTGKIMHVAKKQKTDNDSGQQNSGGKPSTGHAGGKPHDKGGGSKRKKGVCICCGKEGHYQNVCRKQQFDLMPVRQNKVLEAIAGGLS
ncbi:putative Gag-pol Polyprotein [Phytophthora cinnamomi]|uniref:putative Gag-pol Polyprotein n=1 Tax=Phytophthora cinnamomi TaxID=4785 RepID=UPI00355AB689|nr:putative Gag-pol Polyprotein [Phytophthora cinnamomi]